MYVHTVLPCYRCEGMDLGCDYVSEDVISKFLAFFTSSIQDLTCIYDKFKRL